MHRRKRRAAILMGSAAVAMLLATGLLLREDVRWWWRMRGVVQVYVSDFVLGEHVVEGPGPVAEAVRATRSFLEPLPEKPPSETEIVGYMSEVVFMRPGSPRVAFSIWLNHVIDSEHGAICCMEDLYTCKLSDWFGYLRDVLKSRSGELTAAWRLPERSPKGRINTAAALALVAPETEGVADYLCSAVAKDPTPIGIWFLGEMGPNAAGVAPFLEALMADHRNHEEVRNAARGALTRIRGE